MVHDPNDLPTVLQWIRAQVADENLRVTQHAQQEMVEEDINLDAMLGAMEVAQILENYPKHRRGSCCLLNGVTTHGRWIHIVCTTGGSTLIIVTVYEPKPPKWVTPTQRRGGGDAV